MGSRYVSRYLAKGRATGFSLGEVMIVLALLGTLSAMVVPNIYDQFEKGKVTGTIGDITGMGVRLETFYQQNGRYPDTLAEVGLGDRVDAQGNAFRYLRIEGSNNTNAARRDRFLVPLNSDYDLYSMGADGLTSRQLSFKTALDDVVRANDGAFVGLASEY